MMAPPSFTRELLAYDSALRCRWGKYTEKWLIERQMPLRHPQLRGEAPTSERSARQKDLAQGYAEGYVHVLSVAPSLLAWQHVAPALREADLHWAGDWAAMNRRLDEAEAQWEAAQDKERATWTHQASLEAYDHIAYQEGRRVALFDPPERVEQHPDGFLIKDRRIGAA